MPKEWWEKPRWNDSDWEHSGGQFPEESEFRDAPDNLQGVCPKFACATVDLNNLTIPDGVIEVITESMARENMVIAVRFEGHAVVIAMADPNNLELLDKLRFVLNRGITPVVARLDSILAAIDRHYP